MNKLLIANRGEIAVRVVVRGPRARAADRRGPLFRRRARAARRRADEAVLIGDPPRARAATSTASAILDAAGRTGAEAIHPGYGFLAENAAFAHACIEAGLTFVGPPPEVIEQMGDKARRAAAR